MASNVTMNTWSQELTDVNSTSEPYAAASLSHGAHMGLAVYLLITGVFGSVGNCLTIVMFATGKELTSSVDFLLMNLAIADLCMCAFCFPFVSAANFAERWVFGDVGCTIYGYLGFMFGNAAICTLTAISLQRYLVICRHHSNKRDHTTNMQVLFIWFQALVWSSLPLLLPMPYALEPFGTSCTVAWASPDRGTRVFIYALVILVLLHFLVLTGCYMGIYFTARRDVITTSSRSHQDLLVSKICFVAVAAFVICWAPYAVFSLWLTDTSTAVQTIFTALPVMLAKMSSCINPLVYIVVSKRFRQQYLRLITCRRWTVCADEQTCPQSARDCDLPSQTLV